MRLTYLSLPLLMLLFSGCGKKEPVRGEIKTYVELYNPKTIEEYLAKNGKLPEGAKVVSQAEIEGRAPEKTENTGTKTDGSDSEKAETTDGAGTEATKTGEENGQNTTVEKGEYIASDLKQAEKKPLPNVILKEVEFYVNPAGQRIPHGKSVQYYINGQIQYKGQMLDGKQDGEWIYYYADGKKMELWHFKDGLRDGELKAWYPNGQLKLEGKSVEDKHDGKWTYYNQDGSVQKEEVWDEGKKIK